MTFHYYRETDSLYIDLVTVNHEMSNALTAPPQLSYHLPATIAHDGCHLPFAPHPMVRAWMVGIMGPSLQRSGPIRFAA